MSFRCMRRLAALLPLFAIGALVAACDPTPTIATPAGIGQTVRDGTFDFTVTKVENAPTFRALRAQGVFVVVSLTVKNVGVDPQLFDRSAQQLKDSVPRQYSASFMDPTSLGKIGNSMDAGLQVNVRLAFDVPPSTKPAQIVLHESQSSEGVPVNLAQPQSQFSPSRR